MKKFTICKNKYLDRDVVCYYHQDYVGYQKEGNPDFVNHLKNMTKQYKETDLVEDFIKVCDYASFDIRKIIAEKCFQDAVVCVIPRSKSEKSYSQSQLMFKKAISSVTDTLRLKNGIDAIKRMKNTKTTHNWRLENNTGSDPYKGITKDTCVFDEAAINGKNLILVDDIYTKDVNVCEDCLQTLFDLGAKSCIMYVIAKTRS